MSIDTAFALIRICFYLVMTCVGMSVAFLLMMVVRGEIKHRIHHRRRVLHARERDLAELERSFARSAEEEQAWYEMVDKNPTVGAQLNEVYAAYERMLSNQKTYITSPEDTIIDGAL